jgi:hypothetical protein
MLSRDGSLSTYTDDRTGLDQSIIISIIHLINELLGELERSAAQLSPNAQSFIEQLKKILKKHDMSVVHHVFGNLAMLSLAPELGVSHKLQEELQAVKLQLQEELLKTQKLDNKVTELEKVVAQLQRDKYESDARNVMRQIAMNIEYELKLDCIEYMNEHDRKKFDDNNSNIDRSTIIQMFDMLDSTNSVE